MKNATIMFKLYHFVLLMGMMVVFSVFQVRINQYNGASSSMRNAFVGPQTPSDTNLRATTMANASGDCRPVVVHTECICTGAVERVADVIQDQEAINEEPERISDQPSDPPPQQTPQEAVEAPAFQDITQDVERSHDQLSCGCLVVPGHVNPTHTTPWGKNQSQYQSTAVPNPHCPCQWLKNTPVPLPSHVDKILTIMTPYYNDVGLLLHFLEAFSKFSPDLTRQVQFVIIDDGSQSTKSLKRLLNRNRQAILDLFPHEKSNTGFIQAYEIDQDLPWHVAGAKNLGIYYSPTDWVWSLDSDYVPTPDMFQAVLDYIRMAPPQTQVHTRFPLYEIPINATVQHPALMIVSRSAYFMAAGFDEDLVVDYGYDDILFNDKLDKWMSPNHLQVIHVMTEERIEGTPQANAFELGQAFPGYFHALSVDTCPEWGDCFQGSEQVEISYRHPRNSTRSSEIFMDKHKDRMPFSTEMLRFSWSQVEW
ncbi:Glycosyl transferase family 2 [Seminavis robusta]|uniref:Glycosyl transferase family 2 n=1 Tax=Seminavis robusta TaxID=568900 RepID=A0A9N8DIU8_9STRA|nr:Glycosyl transferase family 2 [Seminavis robusta]|eukprot:Sro167_g074580.1 Glycosyl transferase family 2 (479) ;mRNA; f:79879-81315